MGNAAVAATPPPRPPIRERRRSAVMPGAAGVSAGCVFDTLPLPLVAKWYVSRVALHEQ
jgi:hypothetical protein